MIDHLYKDRQAAGLALARKLAEKPLPRDTLVLGLPRGGVPVASEIARTLNLELDVLNLRKLGLPDHPEVAMGAIAEDGTRYLDRELIGRLGISDEQIQKVEEREKELAVRVLRKRRAARIIVAVPVGPVGTAERFSEVADQCVCLLEPKFFNSVGLWYLDFHQVPEERVIEAIRDSLKNRSRRFS